MPVQFWARDSCRPRARGDPYAAASHFHDLADDVLLLPATVVMGPCFRRDDLSTPGADRSGGYRLLVVNERRQSIGLGDDAHTHRSRATADFNVLPRQRIVGNARSRAHAFREDDLAAEAFGHVLQPRRDVDGVAECGEHHVVAVADIADDDLAAVNADPESDRLPAAASAWRQAICLVVASPNRASCPSPRNWFGWPPHSITAFETAPRKRLTTKTVSNGKRFSASRVEPRMSTNMLTR